MPKHFELSGLVDPDGYAITMYDRDALPEGWENA